MGVPRVYYPGTYHAQELVELDETHAHHLCVVLRKKIGDALTIVCGDNYESPATITHASKKKLVVQVGAPQLVNKESPLAIHLAQSLGKGDKFEFIIQKAVELGVAEITPIISTKSAFSSLEQTRLNKKFIHWQNIIISAIEQCGRNTLPKLNPVISFMSFLETRPQGQKWILSPNLKQSLNETSSPLNLATVLIGPEGGWASSELDGAIKSDFSPLTMGPRVLRTETAPIATIAILQAKWGDLS